MLVSSWTPKIWQILDLEPRVTTLESQMSTVNSNISSLTTRITTLEAMKIQATTLTTDSSGRITWTFPVAYSTTPVVSTDVRASSGQPYTLKTISISNTAIVLDVYNSTAVTILSISVLGALALVGAGISVHIIAMKAS